MKKVICSIYDAKAECWLEPQMFMANGQAVRSFSDAVNALRGENEISRHPEDFTIFALGEWDEQSGEISVFPVASALEKGINLKEEGEAYFPTNEGANIPNMRKALQ